jgi:hypothetical protein
MRDYRRHGKHIDWKRMAMDMPVIGSTGPSTTFASWPGFGLWRADLHLGFY